MPTFVYKARNQTGESVSGTLVAESTMAAARMLDERALLPVEVEELREQARSVFTGRARRINQSKIGVVYEQLSDLLRAGVPVLRALSVLSKQASSPAIGRVLREVHDGVAGGDTLADAMGKHPHAFMPLHVSMVRAGEKGGFLEDVLTRLSEFVARQDALKNKFIGSMIYPSILLTAGISAVLLLMLMVVPNIRTLLESQQVPWVTQFVFTLSDVLGKYYFQLAIVLAVLGGAVATFFSSALGHDVWAKIQLKTPGIGRIYTMVSLCRFCRIFGTLLANGIPILNALKISRDSAGNKYLAEAIDKAAEAVNLGEQLSGPLAQSKVFPPAMIDMIAVAEESNTLEKVLVEIANTQEERTGRQIELFVRLLEPLMLLFMGVMVMTIAIALLLPIMQLATSGFQ
ncbi:MAG: type II secretion system F family protein [Planctomycetes bacterium]|nr:type II secretion system F family protein [Planctomycetota bacterium]